MNQIARSRSLVKCQWALTPIVTIDRHVHLSRSWPPSFRFGDASRRVLSRFLFTVIGAVEFPGQMTIQEQLQWHPSQSKNQGLPGPLQTPS